MAAKIEPNAPRPPQVRKQAWSDSAEAFVPVPDLPQEKPVTEAVPLPEEARPFIVGDAVTLSGRVLEVHALQGGHTNVKVQLPQGAVWLSASYLQHAEVPKKK